MGKLAAEQQERPDGRITSDKPPADARLGESMIRENCQPQRIQF
jgi:hypothetical protein